MNLFEIKNFVVTFSPQALELAPFKEIWDNDTSKDKRNALKELSYVYYMCDDRSDYIYELDDEMRSDNVIQVLNMDPNWIIPKYIGEAMDYYRKQSETTSTKLLRSTRNVVQKISKFLDDIDPNERDKRTNKPVFNIAQIVASVEKMPKLLKALNEVEKEVIKEKAINTQNSNRDTGVNDDSGI